jgi:type III restriction enzyme
LLACYASGLAMKELLHAERSIVLWLVPSNTILDQTLKGLKEKNHPYRQALETACGEVEVVSIEEALHLSRATADGQTVVIVSTIQSFRVEDQTGRKVYDQNGAFSEHLLNLPASRIADLLPGADGKPKPALINMLRLRHPIVIVDEAHNARTSLSFSTLGNLLPSCIIEFTATPARAETPSNVLHRVSAAELKEEEMIKLPLRIITRDPSQRDHLLADAKKWRDDLELLAIAEGQMTNEYIRPIMLIQAERVDACEPLRERMVRDLDIPRDQIKISTGSLDELKNLEDIYAVDCPIRYIITVEKLREGWDCQFAYILCSLKETHSATAIEQIVGRILRLPKAKTKRHQDLNCSYAFSVSHSLIEVLHEFREALESNGFTKAEAERIISPVFQPNLLLGAQPRTITLEPKDIDPTIAPLVEGDLAGKVKINPDQGTITVVVPLNDKETEKLTGVANTPQAKTDIRNLVKAIDDAEKAFGSSNLTRIPSPYELQLDFIVPRLAVEENGELFDFDETFILDHDWRLSEKDASLSPYYNPTLKPEIKAGIVDVSKAGMVETTQVSDKPDIDFVTQLQQHVFQLGIVSNWTMEILVGWLDKRIEHKDISVSESAEFLRKAIRGLMTKYGITDIDILANDRYRLREEIDKKIQEHREMERKSAFQQYLLTDSKLAIGEESLVNFKAIDYAPSKWYEGSYQFKKHYFPKPGDLDELTAAKEQTEEFRCAHFIDGLDEIRFWVRNIARRSTSFRLQTSRDYFYPDFICQLNDGRILVVEYKGENIYDAPDAEEKKAIGTVWASRSKGRCLFVMPTKKDFSVITQAVKTPPNYT